MAPPQNVQDFRCVPHTYRVMLRRGLLLEPSPGTAAMVQSFNLRCPDCSVLLSGFDTAGISAHLACCGTNGGWYHQAGAVNRCVKSFFTDVGVMATLEPPNTSPGTTHRAADVGSAPIPVPPTFVAGGTHSLACDSAVWYFTPTRAAQMASKPGWGAEEVERRKPAKMAREMAQGKRAPLAAGTTFLALGIDERGRVGSGFPKLMDWLADHAVAHANLMLPGMTAANLRVRLITTWRIRLSVALQRALAESYLRRSEDIRKQAALRLGVRPLEVADVLMGMGRGGVGD